MLRLTHPLTNINGFKIGDKVRLKDGDGRPHTIKSFAIDGLKAFFFEVEFEDGTRTMLDNISLLPSNLDEAAEDVMPEGYGFIEVDIYGGSETIYSREQMLAMFKAGAEWMAGQGVIGEGEITKDISNSLTVSAKIPLLPKFFKFGDKVSVTVKEK